MIATMKDNYNNVRICPYMDPNGIGTVDRSIDRYSPISSDSYYNDNLPQFCDLKLDPDILKWVNDLKVLLFHIFERISTHTIF